MRNAAELVAMRKVSPYFGRVSAMPAPKVTAATMLLIASDRNSVRVVFSCCERVHDRHYRALVRLRPQRGNRPTHLQRRTCRNRLAVRHVIGAQCVRRRTVTRAGGDDQRTTSATVERSNVAAPIAHGGIQYHR